MWVSCTRASGCLQSYMIYRGLLGESAQPCPHTWTLLRIQTDAVIPAGLCLQSWDTETDTPSMPCTSLSSTLLCVSLRCQSIIVPLPCPSQSSCDTLPRWFHYDCLSSLGFWHQTSQLQTAALEIHLSSGHTHFITVLGFQYCEKVGLICDS